MLKQIGIGLLVIAIFAMLVAAIIFTIKIQVAKSNRRKNRNREYAESPPIAGFQKTEVSQTIKELIVQACRPFGIFVLLGKVFEWERPKISNIYYQCGGENEIWIFDVYWKSEGPHDETIVCIRSHSTNFVPLSVAKFGALLKGKGKIRAIDAGGREIKLSVELEALLQRWHSETESLQGIHALFNGQSMYFYRENKWVPLADRKQVVEDAIQVWKVARDTLPHELKQ